MFLIIIFSELSYSYLLRLIMKQYNRNFKRVDTSTQYMDSKNLLLRRYDDDSTFDYFYIAFLEISVMDILNVNDAIDKNNTTIQLRFTIYKTRIIHQKIPTFHSFYDNRR